MNRRQFTSVLGAGTLGLGLRSIARPSAAKVGSWDRYKLSDGEFSVLLPTLPAMSSYQVQMENPAKSPLRHLIGCYADGVAYAIYAFDKKQSLESFINEYNHSEAKILKQELNVNEVRGKEYAFRNEELTGRTDYFVTDRHIYIFQGEGSFLGDADAGITKFFESIKFEESKDAAIILDGAGTPWAPTSALVATSVPPSVQIFSAKQVTRKVLVITKPEPTYTEVARRRSTAGTVVIRCVFRSTGVVSDLHVISGLDDGLTENALAAAKQIKFIPAINEGHFVSMWMELQYNFNLY